MTEADQNNQPTRSIELAIEVPGTPDEVWRAVATGPGISSWYVRHDVDERVGGDVELSFGPGMDVTGRVVAWAPPNRVVFDGGDAVGLAFEWIVEARDGGSCVVRLVNTGFGSGDDWDDQYDGMSSGWRIFLTNLRLHLEHFAGRSATPSVPMASWDGPPAEAWVRLRADLGVGGVPMVGEHFEVDASDVPTLAGTVAEISSSHLALVGDQPAAGTAFLAAERAGDTASISIWSYLYGDDGAAAVERDEPLWREWLAARGNGESR